MTLNEWLDAERGRLSALAEHFHVSSAAVAQWRLNGVPTAKILSVRDFTEGHVSVEEMLDPNQRASGARNDPAMVAQRLVE